MRTARATLSDVGLTVATAVRSGPSRRDGIGVAIVATAAAVLGTVVEIVEASGPVPPPAVGVVLAVLAGAATAVRRVPVVAAAAVVAVCLLYHVLGFPGLAPAVVLFAGLYTVTSRGSGSRSLLAVGVVIAAVSAVPLLPPAPAGFGWAIVGPAVGLVAAAAVGEAARARRLAVDEQLNAVRRAAEQDAQRHVVEDRVEVAREVHDVLAHTITVIAVQAAAAAEAIDERPDDARAALAAVRGAARDALTELRATVSLLRTGTDPEGSEPGLARLVELRDRAAAAGLDVTLSITGARALPRPVERAVYRIVQEALTNTVRHAAAAAAAVRVDVGAVEVRVEITDDGCAIPGRAAGVAGGGHGLAGMRERALALGGTLEAGPVQGRGFTVTARLPAGAPR